MSGLGHRVFSRLLMKPFFSGSWTYSEIGKEPRTWIAKGRFFGIRSLVWVRSGNRQALRRCPFCPSSTDIDQKEPAAFRGLLASSA